MGYENRKVQKNDQYLQSLEKLVSIIITVLWLSNFACDGRTWNSFPEDRVIFLESIDERILWPDT